MKVSGLAESFLFFVPLAVSSAGKGRGGEGRGGEGRGGEGRGGEGGGEGEKGGERMESDGISEYHNLNHWIVQFGL